MCGIALLLQRRGRGILVSDVRNMKKAISHRGPDAKGMCESHAGVFDMCAIFARLSILDRSGAGHQPMQSLDGKVLILWNGEAYNHDELRRELISCGRYFRGRSDTEVVLNGYLEWREGIFERIDGMFGAVIWDEDQKCLLLARDRFGQKPLYFRSLADQGLAVASEKKALVWLQGTPAAVNWRKLAHRVNSTPNEFRGETVFDEIQALPAATIMKVDLWSGRRESSVYWRADAWDDLNRRTSVQTSKSETKDAIHRSLLDLTRCDVPYTLALSGGLDSSILAAVLASDRDRFNFSSEVISVGLSGSPKVDETERVLDTAAHLSLTVNFVEVSPRSLVRDIERLHWFSEDPVPGLSMYLEWELMKTARQLGFPVVISGQGADELFAGYGSHVGAHLLDELSSLFRIRQGGRCERRSIGLRDLALAQLGTSYQMSNRQVIWSLLSESRRKAVARTRVPKHWKSSFLSATIWRELHETALPANLYFGDRNSMAHGVELRHPYLSNSLVDYALTLHRDDLLSSGWRKAALRNLGDEILPTSVTRNPLKLGFAAPEDEWLKDRQVLDWMYDHLFGTDIPGKLGYQMGHLQRMWTKSLSGSSPVQSHLWRLASASQFAELFSASAHPNFTPAA